MPKGSGGEPSWWSSGSVPDDLPSWARRGLDEAPEELAPSPPPPRSRHRRRGAAAAPVAAGGSHRLRGWGLAAASVAAAAAVVPLAVSTLANNGENTALPRVGTFPVVAPGTLPDGAVPPGTGTRGPQPGSPADASVLPPLQDPSVALAEPPRTVTVAPAGAGPRRRRRDHDAVDAPFHDDLRGRGRRRDHGRRQQRRDPDAP